MRHSHSSGKGNPAFLLGGLCLLLAGCGTMGKLRSVHGDQAPEFSNYNRVIVRSFGETASTEIRDAAARAEKATEMSRVVITFANQITEALKSLDVFEFVGRDGHADSNTLVVTGEITAYEEGDASSRLLVGLGVGSSYFDARIEVREFGGQALAEMVIDKNSWPLGGIIASGQTVEGFMEDAAEHLAEELKAAKGRKTRSPMPSAAAMESR